MDKASMVATRPAPVLGSYDVISSMAFSRFDRLRFLKLQGFVLPQIDLGAFLYDHLNILRELDVTDCVIFGSWQNVLEELLGSESLHSLKLHQLGSGFREFFRVEFPDTCDTHLSRTGKTDEWCKVNRSWYTTRILQWQNWDLRLNAIIHDLVVGEDVVDPAAEDADKWI